MIFITALLALLIGLVIGFFAAQRYFKKNHTAEQSQQELDAAKVALKRYRLQVIHHLTKTAELLEQAQSHYQTVQEQIYHSAQQLGLEHDNLASHYHLVADEDESLESAPKTTTIHSMRTKPPKDYVNE